MPVRIIEPAADPSAIRIVVCKCCGATLEYAPQDVLTNVADYVLWTDEEEFIVCPNCNVKVILRAW